MAKRVKHSRGRPKDRKQVNFRLAPDLVEQLDIRAESMGLSRQQLIEKVMRLVLAMETNEQGRTLFVTEMEAILENVVHKAVNAAVLDLGVGVLGRGKHEG